MHKLWISRCASSVFRSTNKFFDRRRHQQQNIVRPFSAHFHPRGFCSSPNYGVLNLSNSAVSVRVLGKDSSVDPISLARVHRGSYYLTLGKLKGSRNCLRMMRNERRKVKMMKRSRKSERTLTSCMHGDDNGME